ncbi:MAG: TCP-1/cpn60 chaperonin family protein, partial [Micromonosporaceae bacterium]
GQVVSAEVGLKLDSVGIEALGRARRVVVTKDATTIIEGAGKSKDVKARADQIRTEIEQSDSDWDREKLQERLAKIAGGVAVIKAGAATEVEMKEKKHRIEDAISATRAAVEEGIVVGGGSALVHAAAALEKGLSAQADGDGDFEIGVAIVRKSLDEPLRWIAQNGGLDGYVVVSKVRDLGYGQGLNAATGEYTDLLAAGIVDPVKVARNAVANAASIAGLLLTTETLIVEKPARSEADAGNHGHGHGHQHGPGF